MKHMALLLGAAMALGFPQYGLAGTETIALTGGQAGGTPAGAMFSTFDTPLLNDAGQVAFTGTLMTGTGGVTANNDMGIWRGASLIAREGSQAGGMPAGAVFGDFGSLVLNDAGQVAYTGTLQVGSGNVDSSNDTGIWRDMTLVAREGNLAGGIAGGALFSSFLPDLSLNNAGQIVYVAELRMGVGGVNSLNNIGIWRSTALIAREGNQAGGTPSGSVFTVTNKIFGSPALNDTGQVAFEAFLRLGTGGADATNDNGIWRGETLIAREGSQAGGVPTGAVFTAFSDPLISDAGQVAYVGGLEAGLGGVDSTNDSGIWRDSTLIAREGSQAGGVPSGAVFHSFQKLSMINSVGQIAYTAFLRQGVGGVDNDNNYGIWLNSTLIAREGSQAGDAPAGAVFNSLQGPVISDGGQVAYEGFLRAGTGGVDVTNDNGIWITGTNGESLLVVREGDSLAGRTVSSLVFSDTTGAIGLRRLGLNNFSQLAYKATFTNGDEGVFLYTPDIRWTEVFSGSWDTADNWTIGQLPGDPHDVFIDPAGSLTVFGPTGDAVMENLTVGGGTGIAVLALQQGGSIQTMDTGVLILANGVLRGDGVIASASGVVNQGTVIAGNLHITGGLFNEQLVAGDGQITAPLFNALAGEVRVAAGEHLRFLGTAESINDGRIEVVGGQIEFEHNITNDNPAGLITGRDAVLRFNGGLTNKASFALSFGTSDVFGDVNNTGAIVLTGGSNTTFYDDVDNDGSIMVASVGPHVSAAVFLGSVSGSGSITGGGSVFLHGDLRPGNSPAAVFHDVDLFLMSTATTQIELGGTTPGNAPGNHDQINNLKSTTRGGTLDIQLINGFDPDAGDTFDIFNLASSIGTFADILLPTIDAGLGWHLGKLYTDGELHVELEGDLNQDGFVGAADLDILLANWGDNTLVFDYAAGDASGDGLVGAADLAVVQANWGSGSPGGTVPEPGGAALLALGGLALLRHRRRAA